MGVLRKKLTHTVLQKYFFLEIVNNVKAGRVKWGTRKLHPGCPVGQACARYSFTSTNHIKNLY
jgi:hypothetical protein